MVQFQPGGSLSAGLGAGIGQGLSSGLQLLAEQRMNQLQKNQQLLTTGKALVGLGFSPEQAAALAGAPPELQKEALKQRGLSELLGGGPEAPSSGEGQLSLGGGQGVPQERLSESETFSTPQGSERLKESETVRPPQGLERYNESQLVGLTARGGGVGQAAKAELDRRKSESEKEFKERQFTQKERDSALKETKEYRKGISEGADAARSSKAALDRLEELETSGDLDNPGVFKFLQHIGWEFLLKPDTVEYQALSLGLTAGMTKAFGGRINREEFKTFLRRIPELSQTAQGRKQIIRMKRLIEVEPALLKQRIYNDITKGNQSPPFNIEQLVNERYENEVGKFAEKVQNDLQRSEKLFEKSQKKSDATKFSGPFQQGKKSRLSKNASSQKSSATEIPEGNVLVKDKKTGQLGYISKDDLGSEGAKAYEVI